MGHLVSKLVLLALFISLCAVALLLGQCYCRHMLVVDVVLLLKTSLLPVCVSSGIGVERIVVKLRSDGVVCSTTSNTSRHICLASTASWSHTLCMTRGVLVLSSSRHEQLRTVSSKRDRISNAMKDRV